MMAFKRRHLNQNTFRAIFDIQLSKPKPIIMTLTYTPLNQITPTFTHLLTSFSNQKPNPIPYRINQLKSLYNLLTDNRETICEAIHQDLKKHKHEAFITEISIVTGEIIDSLDYINKWTKDDVVSTDLIFKTDTCLVRSEAFGVVLIMGAWVC